MMAKATTRADVLRDVDTTDRDGFGDETETAGPPVYAGVPVAIIERTQRVPDATSASMVTVAYLVGRCSGLLDVRTGDRLLDLRDGWLYGVQGVSQPSNPVRVLDKRLDLTLVAQRQPDTWVPPTGPLHEGHGPPPAVIPGARVGDIYLDLDTGNLYELKG